jgi:antitoxin VapB
MNSPYSTKTFKSGNSAAVRLHRALGLPADIEVTAEPLGNGVWIRPKGKRQTLAEMSAKLLALGPVGEIERREVDLPERPGL